MRTDSTTPVYETFDGAERTPESNANVAGAGGCAGPAAAARLPIASASATATAPGLMRSIIIAQRSGEGFVFRERRRAAERGVALDVVRRIDGRRDGGPVREPKAEVDEGGD